MQSRRVAAPVAEALRAYEETGSQAAAARQLGISRTTVRRYLAQSRPPPAPEPISAKPSIADLICEFLTHHPDVAEEIIFRRKVEDLWAKDPAKLMSEVERLYNATK